MSLRPGIKTEVARAIARSPLLVQAQQAETARVEVASASAIVTAKAEEIAEEVIANIDIAAVNTAIAAKFTEYETRLTELEAAV